MSDRAGVEPLKRLCLAWLLVVATACSAPQPGPDAGHDAGADAGASDAGTGDGGARDGGADAGLIDDDAGIWAGGCAPTPTPPITRALTDCLDDYRRTTLADGGVPYSFGTWVEVGSAPNLWSIAYDHKRDVTIGVTASETFLYDGGAWSFAGSDDGGSADSRLVWDADRQQVVRVSAASVSGWNGADWVTIIPVAPPRYVASIGWSETLGVVSVTSDGRVYAIADAGWVEASSDTWLESPGSRQQAAVAFDCAQRLLLVAGGQGVQGYTYDTAQVRPPAGPWSAVALGTKLAIGTGMWDPDFGDAVVVSRDRAVRFFDGGVCAGRIEGSCAPTIVTRDARRHVYVGVAVGVRKTCELRR